MHETAYPVIPFLALPRMRHKILFFKDSVSGQPLTPTSRKDPPRHDKPRPSRSNGAKRYAIPSSLLDTSFTCSSPVYACSTRRNPRYTVAGRTRGVRRRVALSRCGLGAFHRIQPDAVDAEYEDQWALLASPCPWQAHDGPTCPNPPQSGRARGAPAPDQTGQTPWHPPC